MSQESNKQRRVLVVGVDLTEVSEHLLAYARDVVKWVDEAELHVVHVVRPEPFTEKLNDPIGNEGIVTAALRKSAEWELEQLCRRIVGKSLAKWHVHVRVGHAADVLMKIASEVDADFIVIEAHGPDRIFHRSVVAQIARDAPCSVLTVRAPKGSEPAEVGAMETVAQT